MIGGAGTGGGEHAGGSGWREAPRGDQREREPQPPALELIGLTVRYGAATIIENLSLELAPGEILGFLGPNGAGKTTTLRALFGLLRRPGTVSGAVRLLGADWRAPDFRPALRRAGFVPDPDGLDPRLSGERLLNELAALSGAPPLDREPVCAALELRPADLRQRIGQLSRGTRQKIALVQGMQHRPDLLVLDEPGEGLDPLARHGLNQLLLAARARGAAVLFSSHDLAEVEAVCDRVAMIRAGRLLAVERLAELRGRMPRQVRLRLVPGARPEPPPGAAQLRADGAGWRFGWSGPPGPLLAWLAAQPVAEVSIAPPSLAELFGALYGERRDD